MKKLIALIIVMLMIITILTLRLVNAHKIYDEIEIEPVITEEVIDVVEEVEDIPEAKKELINILLIGVDGTGYGKDKRSDVMIIATIDSNDKVLRLTSVARDMYSYLPNTRTYEKINHSYARGGPENTMKAINTNLDLDIQDYIVFDYKALISAVDKLGGYPVNLTNQEVKDMNIHGDRVYSGEQILSGKDAITYMRIRYNSGGDTGRNQRQRDLIVHIMKETQDMNKTELLKFSTTMLPLVKTSYDLLDVKELLDIYINIRGGLIMEQYSYPFEYNGGKLADQVWYATPNTVEINAIQFHNDVLGEQDYTPSDVIEDISATIKRKSRVNNEY